MLYCQVPTASLPEGSILTLTSDNYTLVDPSHHNMKPLGFIDSDLVYDLTVIYIALMSAGDVVGYRCKYQDMIVIPVWRQILW